MYIKHQKLSECAALGSSVLSVVHSTVVAESTARNIVYQYLYVYFVLCAWNYHLFVVHILYMYLTLHIFHILQLGEVQGDGQQDEAGVVELRKYGPTGREYPPHIQEWRW